MSLLDNDDIILDKMDWMTTYMSKFNIKYICMNEHSWGKTLLSTEPLIEHGLVMFDDKKLNKLNIDLETLEENCPIMTGNLNRRQPSKLSKDIKLKIYRICEAICKYYFEHGEGMKNINNNTAIEEYILKLMKPIKKGHHKSVMFRNRRRFNWIGITIEHHTEDAILDDFTIILDCR